MLVRLNGVCCEKQFVSFTKTFLLHLEWWSEINIIVVVIVILVKNGWWWCYPYKFVIFFMKIKNIFVFFKLTVLLKQFLLNFFKLFGCKISIFKRLRCENNFLRKNATSWYKNSEPKKKIMLILLWDHKLKIVQLKVTKNFVYIKANQLLLSNQL